MRIRSRPTALGTALILAAMGPGAGSAGAQQVSYSVIPTYQEIRWDDAFGFDRLRLWGVRGSVDFGPYFSLQPFYEWSDDVEPREGLTPAAGAPSAWEMQTFGADAMINLGRGPIVPFLKGGGGVFRLKPDGGEESDRIVLRYGGGVRFGLGGRLGAELTAQNWTTRLSEPFVAGAVPAAEFPDDGLVDSWVYGAGIRIPLGGDFDATQGARGLVPGIALEPFAVRTDYADELGLARQYGAGVRAGVDFNQNVGLRAHYWRGVDDDFSEFQDVEGYGAEARFALNTGPGLSPFLVAGGGRIRFTDEFFDVEGREASDLEHLTLGGGIAFGLGDVARVELGARNLLMTPGDRLEDVTNPDELVSNWQYSAGLTLTLGASPLSRSAQRAQTDEGRLARAEQIRQEELARLREENRRLRAGEDPARVQAVEPILGGRTMVVPVPEVGEVILRYGEAYSVQARDAASGMSAEDMRRLEEAVAESLARRGLDVELLEARLPEIVRRVVREELQAMGVRPGAVAPGVVLDPQAREGFQWRAQTTEPYLGLQLHDQTQFLLGVRASMGTLESLPVEVIPELAFGFGEGDTSLLLGLNGRYSFDLGRERRYAPYLQIGAALTNQRLVSLNPVYGLKFDVASDRSGSPIRIFIEHQGLQMYRDHRLLAGIVLDR